ncbi:MAG: hypothetical protein ACE5K4_10990 [Candidatus Hydrothermarchaeota archaeon]
MTVKLKCPFCGCDTFIRKNADAVEIIDEGDTIRDELLQEDVGIYEYFCNSCDKEVTDVELVR